MPRSAQYVRMGLGACLLLVIGLTIGIYWERSGTERETVEQARLVDSPPASSDDTPPTDAIPETAERAEPSVLVQALPIAPFVEKAIDWLAQSQHESGGWGAGSHTKQQIRDPSIVKTDPATTAFSAMALVRAGHTTTTGEYREVVRRATEYLLRIVEKAPADGGKITDIVGTQPQAKMGPLVDTSMTAQFLARILPTLADSNPLHPRVDAALEKCIDKIQGSQLADGSWGKSGGWAPVLQSSLGTTALELAQAIGKNVDMDRLTHAREYQKGNFDADSGEVRTGSSAGVALYAFAGSQRAGAAEASAAKIMIDDAKVKGDLPASAEVSEENLMTLGMHAGGARRLTAAFNSNERQIARLNDDKLLAGFGNNGGEEYLSYLMTSESLVIAGGEEWTKWNEKMHVRLEKIQNNDGSWAGHHCITSPVFCTAAVVQCLTADRDAVLLAGLARSECHPEDDSDVAGKDN
ncbi:MAG: terpene cyclase/mutase family protein [Planctomycetota bacterium]|nr:terpene cyclase/mutase family protein [Planctomycetota bacterium]